MKGEALYYMVFALGSILATIVSFLIAYIDIKNFNPFSYLSRSITSVDQLMNNNFYELRRLIWAHEYEKLKARFIKIFELPTVINTIFIFFVLLLLSPQKSFISLLPLFFTIIMGSVSGRLYYLRVTIEKKRR